MTHILGKSIDESLIPGFKTAENFGDPNKFYRVFSGNQAYEDILESGKIRTQGSPSYKGTNPHLMLSEHPSLADRIKSRPTAWPSFAKGKADLSFAQGLPDHYIIETEEKLIPSKSGRHSRGSTYFPMDEKGLDVDKTKTKIYKHLGEGKYEQVRSTATPKKKKSLAGVFKGLGRATVAGLAGAPAFEFLSPPSAGPSDPEDPVYRFETGQMSLDEFTKRIKGEVPLRVTPPTLR